MCHSSCLTMDNVLKFVLPVYPNFRVHVIHKFKGQSEKSHLDPVHTTVLIHMVSFYRICEK